jgi:hypothetical protein
MYVCSVACWLSQVHWLLELHVALSLAAFLQVFRSSLTEYSMSWTRYRLDIAARDQHLRQLALTGKMVQLHLKPPFSTAVLVRPDVCMLLLEHTSP